MLHLEPNLCRGISSHVLRLDARVKAHQHDSVPPICDAHYVGRLKFAPPLRSRMHTLYPFHTSGLCTSGGRSP
jgi:hypothetical protein